MTNQEILNVLQNTKKGTYVRLIKVKDLGNGVIKETKMRVRVGVSYSKMKINKDRETQSLKWGHWVEGLENLVLEHKGNYYLRITTTNPNNEGNGDVIDTKYLLNGNEVSKESVLSLLDNKKLESNYSPVYNIKFENIVSLG